MLPSLTRAAALILATLLACQGVSVGATEIYPDIEHTGVSPDDPLAAARLAELITARERADGPFSVSLYRPLRHLGLIQLEAGQAEAALEAFSRMQHIVHRHEGVYSINQLESVDYAINALMAMGDARRADQHHTLRLRTAESELSENDPTLSLARLKAADWYRNTLRFQRARALYHQVLDTSGLEDRISVRALRSLALTDYLADRCCAEDSLQSALSIVEAGPYDREEQSRARQDLLDLVALTSARQARDLHGNQDVHAAYLGFGNVRDFITFHRDRLTLAPNSELYVRGEYTPEETTPIGAPVTMCGRTYADLSPSHSNPTLSVHLRIDADGRPSSIDIEGEAPHRLKRYLRESLKAGRYRPATDNLGDFREGVISFKQTFEPTTVAVSSQSPVSDWQHLMVAQACQLSFGTRI